MVAGALGVILGAFHLYLNCYESTVFDLFYSFLTASQYRRLMLFPKMILRDEKHGR